MAKFDISSLKFDDNGLIPAVVQDTTTLEVLMVAWMNKLSLEKTFETNLATFLVKIKKVSLGKRFDFRKYTESR